MGGGGQAIRGHSRTHSSDREQGATPAASPISQQEVDRLPRVTGAAKWARRRTRPRIVGHPGVTHCSLSLWRDRSRTSWPPACSPQARRSVGSRRALNRALEAVRSQHDAVVERQSDRYRFARPMAVIDPLSAPTITRGVSTVRRTSSSEQPRCHAFSASPSPLRRKPRWPGSTVRRQPEHRTPTGSAMPIPGPNPTTPTPLTSLHLASVVDPSARPSPSTNDSSEDVQGRAPRLHASAHMAALLMIRDNEGGDQRPSPHERPVTRRGFRSHEGRPKEGIRDLLRPPNDTFADTFVRGRW